jgi:hypothetical protein
MNTQSLYVKKPEPDSDSEEYNSKEEEKFAHLTELM